MSQKALTQLIALGILLFVLVIGGSQATYIIEPGHRGVRVTLGKVSEDFLPEGFGFRPPFISNIVSVNIRQRTMSLDTETYSQDLQQVNVRLRVLFRIPEQSVVTIYREYFGEPFESLIAPRVSEALKEVTATQSAERIVQNREEVKNRTLVSARAKITDLLDLVDITILDISLSPELENAIEAKMVQEQEAAKARFVQQRTEIEAQTRIISAQGEAEAIRIRGQALSENPDFISLQIVEKWDGRTPLVIGGSAEGDRATNILLPISRENR